MRAEAEAAVGIERARLVVVETTIRTTMMAAAADTSRQIEATTHHAKAVIITAIEEGEAGASITTHRYRGMRLLLAIEEEEEAGREAVGDSTPGIVTKEAEVAAEGLTGVLSAEVRWTPPTRTRRPYSHLCQRRTRLGTSPPD